MKKIYSIISLIGIVIWSTTIFLRDTLLMDYEIIKRILWVTPNFGAVWAGVGFTYLSFPYIFKRDFTEKHIIHLVGVIFVLSLISETIHHLFLNAPFDIWDMLVSAIASIVIILIHTFSKRS